MSKDAKDDVQTELEKRLARLRSPPTRPATSASRSSGTLESRLASLDPPTDEQAEHDVLVGVKNVDDAEVERFLREASSVPKTDPLPPVSSSSAARQLNATLNSYEKLAPEFVSPIEVSFFPKSQGSRTMEEDEALIARLQDELKVEQKHGNAEKGKMGELENRLAGLKAFRAPQGSGTTASSPPAVVAPTDTPTPSLGAPPAAIGMYDFELAGSGSDDDDSDISEESKESKDSEDEDSS